MNLINKTNILQVYRRLIDCLAYQWAFGLRACSSRLFHGDTTAENPVSIAGHFRHRPNVRVERPSILCRQWFSQPNGGADQIHPRPFPALPRGLACGMREADIFAVSIEIVSSRVRFYR